MLLRKNSIGLFQTRFCGAYAMDFKVDEHMEGLRAIQQEIVDRAGWNANLGWKRRYSNETFCLELDLLRAIGARWGAIVRVGPTRELLAWELQKLRPALRSVLLVAYYAPMRFFVSKPGYGMVRKKQIIRYSYGGYSKYRAAVPVTH